MSRRTIVTASAVAVFLLVASVAVAALVTRARMNTTATTGNQAIQYTASETNTGGNPSGIANATATGSGTCSASLASGVLSVTMTNIWADSQCLVGDTDLSPRLWVQNLGAASVAVSPDYPVGFGAPGSGAPIIVEWFNHALVPIVFPLTIGENHAPIQIRLSVDPLVANPSTAYSGEVGLQP